MHLQIQMQMLKCYQPANLTLQSIYLLDLLINLQMLLALVT